MIKFVKSWWPSALVLIAVLWLTLAPHPLPDNHIQLFQGADKIVHALMMGGLTAVLIFDFRRRKPRHGHIVGIKEVIVIAICMFCFSALDEWAQGAMAQGRTADILDFAADSAGIIIISLAEPLLLNKYYTRHRKD